MHGSPGCCRSWTSARIARRKRTPWLKSRPFQSKTTKEQYRPLPRVSLNESSNALMEETGVEAEPTVTLRML